MSQYLAPEGQPVDRIGWLIFWLFSGASMKRGMGVFALFAALLVGPPGKHFLSLPKPAARSGAPVQYVPEAVEAAESSCSEFADQRDAKKSVSRGKLSTLVDRSLHECQGQVKIDRRSLPEGIRFVVTTVPDPLHTHLNLQFDRTIEAIQQAAQDEGYACRLFRLTLSILTRANRGEGLLPSAPVVCPGGDAYARD
jgi:hypothetical protein